MRAVATVLFTMLLALGCVAAAVFALHDGSVLTPPPEAVAEEFTRQVAAGRYDLVRPLQSRAARERDTPEAVRQYAEPLRQSVGALEQVSAVQVSMRENDAEAHVLLQGDTGTVVLAFALVRQHGLWTVDDWGSSAPVNGKYNRLERGARRHTSK